MMPWQEFGLAFGLAVLGMVILLPPIVILLLWWTEICCSFAKRFGFQKGYWR